MLNGLVCIHIVSGACVEINKLQSLRRDMQRYLKTVICLSNPDLDKLFNSKVITVRPELLSVSHLSNSSLAPAVVRGIHFTLRPKDFQ